MFVAKVMNNLTIDVDRNGQYNDIMDLQTTQEKIIKASLVVFSQFGKTKSSTAMIAKKAKVSKPLLFHHFGNKDKLYRACQQFTIQKLSTLKHDLDRHHDMFSQLKHIQLLKLKLEQSYPGIFKFFSIDQPSVPGIPPSPFSLKDKSRFKKGVSSEAFWRLLYYLTLGYQQAMQHEADVALLIRDFQESYAMLETLAIHQEDES